MDAIAEGFGDLRQAFGRRQLAFYFAWTETLARYRRSVLGPLWLVLGTVVGVVGLGFVWSILLDTGRADYVPTLTVGLVVWQLVSGAVSESASLFTRNANSITNIKLPSFLISLQLLSRQLINFAHNLLVVAAVLLVYPQHLSWTILLALPGLLIVVINLLVIIQIVGFLGARYRDIEPLIAALMPILFFLSPVIYQAGQLGRAEVVMAFNPVAHYIRVIRDPVMGVIPGAESYLAVAALTVVTVGLALWLTGSKAHRLPYWV